MERLGHSWFETSNGCRSDVLRHMDTAGCLIHVSLWTRSCEGLVYEHREDHLRCCTRGPSWISAREAAEYNTRGPVVSSYMMTEHLGAVGAPRGEAVRCAYDPLGVGVV